MMLARCAALQAESRACVRVCAFLTTVDLCASPPGATSGPEAVRRLGRSCRRQPLSSPVGIRERCTAAAARDSDHGLGTRGTQARRATRWCVQHGWGHTSTQ